MQPGNKNLKDICDLNQLGHLILKPTCYKGKTPSTIDLIITNHKTRFMKSDTCETIRWYIHFWGKTLPKENLKQFTIGVSIDLSFEAFLEIFQSTLGRFARYKQKSTV